MHRGTIDIEAMLIDWECSRFTKSSSPLTARQEWEKLKEELKMCDYYSYVVSYYPELKTIDEILNKLGL